MGTRKTRLTNEQLVAALIETGSVRAAAEKLEAGERTIYNRMHDKAFLGLYDRARADILRAGVHAIVSRVEAAGRVLGDVLEDPDAGPTARIAAARVILDNAVKLVERYDLGGRDLQEAAAETAEADDPLTAALKSMDAEKVEKWMSSLAE